MKQNDIEVKLHFIFLIIMTLAVVAAVLDLNWKSLRGGEESQRALKLNSGPRSQYHSFFILPQGLI
jgi:hypothetical protein